MAVDLPAVAWESAAAFRSWPEPLPLRAAWAACLPLRLLHSASQLIHFYLGLCTHVNPSTSRILFLPTCFLHLSWFFLLLEWEICTYGYLKFYPRLNIELHKTSPTKHSDHLYIGWILTSDYTTKGREK